MIELRGMEASYDADSQTYTITGITAKDAHVLIWGGKQEDINAAEIALRHTLVAAEDGQMTNEQYLELFQHPKG